MLTFREHYLKKIFEPRSIAVIGASERLNSVGTKLFSNLLAGGYRGKLFAVNPKHTTVQGQVSFPSVRDIPEKIELAVCAIPAKQVPKVIAECGKKGISKAIIISAGFSEIGPYGREIEDELLATANRYNIKFIGPNCLGIMRPSICMNATFDNSFPESGGIALVSQSGAICAAILDWAVDKNIGFSTLISLGNSSSIDVGDVLDYLAVDPKTKSILIYLEGIHHARHFMSGLRAAATIKPVIAIKAGRFSQGSRAALSHTGVMMGDDKVFDTALKRAGVVRVFSIEDLFIAAEILSGELKVAGNRLAVITNGGGAGVMAADSAQERHVELPSLEKNVVDSLNKVLPQHWSHQNPIDIIGDATPKRYHDTLNACMESSNIDGILTILVPVAMSNPYEVAKQIVRDAKRYKKALLACWMGEKQVKKSLKLFEKNHIPSFSTPESAVKAFSFSANYAHNQKLLLQLPETTSIDIMPDLKTAQKIIQSALRQQRYILSAIESKNLLEAFSIPITKTFKVKNIDEAIDKVDLINFPVVMKIDSPDITHKQDVDGVALNIETEDQVKIAYEKLISNLKKIKPEARLNGVTIEPMVKSQHSRELIIGIGEDPIFGPVISFGMGGKYVEIIKDQALELPPLNRFLARTLIHQTKISETFSHFRNMAPIDIEGIVTVLLKVSEIACLLPEIKEMDINPLIINENGAVAVDARVILKKKKSNNLYDHLPIHPIPRELYFSTSLKDHTPLLIRAIKPEDAATLQKFMNALSPKAKYLRYLKAFNELSMAVLTRMTQIDYAKEMALLAFIKKDKEEIPVGIIHYATCPDSETCEFGLVVSDAWQNKGIGVKLLDKLMEVAKARGFKKIVGLVLSNNAHMLALADSLGFSLSQTDDPRVNLITKLLGDDQ